jgi:hypothetical protein
LDPAAISGSFVPKLREGVELVALADEAVLFEPDSGQLHQLDQIATLVCSCFDGESSITALVDDLAAGFAADREVIEEDVLALMRRLGELGLLTGVQGVAPNQLDPGTPEG